MYSILKKKVLLCTFILIYINLKIFLNKKVNYMFFKQYNYPNERVYTRYFYIAKIYNKKKKNIKISHLYSESNKVRPERKLECYELNIRNDKKFPKYAKKPVCPLSNLFYFSPFKNIVSSFEPVDYNIKKKLKEEGFQFENEKKESNIFPSLDEIIKNGDPSTNIHFYRRKKLKSLLYGDPLKFVKTRKVIEKYNRRAPPDKQINFDLFRCDIFYVHSDGTIMNIEENRPPYEKKLEESDKHKEPRFIITAPPGHAKKNNFKIGDKFPVINEEAKRKVFDNHFARPKKIRDPLILPDGRKIP
ncbi:conserved Plasmodium protein, unknown function [Plasmodium relictum]|uniref:Uncharacterized protein n=1 Tax=Plasmodium relictum TaxID=85471 RepID=A0A1J1HAY1_PLARL|nr:conserved Plasmodium protein, unknown function [Plasmodium relictum]CRH01657.1 conserved Plasmodium protein, unknown function [Plasmodium relictum]